MNAARWKSFFRRLVFVSLLVVLLVPTTNASFARESVDELALVEEVHAANSSTGEKIYVIGGSNASGGLSLVEVYDPATNTWDVAAPMPAPKQKAAAVALGGYIHVLGGDDRHFRYNPASDAWEELAPMPETTTWHPALGLVDGKIYATIGNQWMYVYDPATDSWASRTPVPVTRSIAGIASLNGKLYAIGGNEPGHEPSEINRIDVYDPATDSWTIGGAATMPAQRTHLPGVIPVLNGRIYVAGGWNGYSAQSTVFVYDPTTDTWASERSMPTARWLPGNAAADSKLYVIGGNWGGSGGHWLAANEELTLGGLPPQGTWISKASMPTARDGMAVVAFQSTSVNSPPDVVADENVVTVDEGQVATNSGTVVDPDGDPVTLSASVGTVINNGDGTWSWSFATSDGPDESQTVTITADDGNGGIDEETFDLAVENVGPTVDLGQDVRIAVFNTFRGTGVLSDPGEDEWEVTVDYGDGSDSSQLAITGKSFDLAHMYIANGTYSVRVTVTDDDGDSGTDTLTVTVLTPQDAVQDVIGQVDQMIDAGVLSRGVGNSLIRKLTQAICSLNRGKPETAINQLGAAVAHIYGLYADGILSREDGQPLIKTISTQKRLLRPERKIEFSGYTWNVKAYDGPAGRGPGFNLWSDRQSDVRVDDDGRLHLKVVHREDPDGEGKWYCTEVYTVEPLGFGAYNFTLASRVDRLDPNIVLGLFTYDEFDYEVFGPFYYREIDIEFAKWGKDGDNAWFTVQPYDIPENQYSFNLELSGDYSHHTFDWTAERVQFSSYHGHPSSPGGLIDAWLYWDQDYIPLEGEENARINLWIYLKDPDTGESKPQDYDGEEVEVIVEAFEFIPHP